MAAGKKSCPAGRSALCLVAAICLLTAIAPAQPEGLPADHEVLTLEPIASGLTRPVWVTSPPKDASRLFILEQNVGGAGRVRIVSLRDKRLLPTPFLNVPKVDNSYEGGLLGLAFHPSYPDNGYLYIYYTTHDNTINPVAPHRASRLERYRVSRDDPNKADPSTRSLILSFPQPAANHNGGWLAFGSAGYLYLSTGDGGPANNPSDSAQALADNPATSHIHEHLMGRILRIDLSGDAFPHDPRRNYSIPPDNPFATTGAPETWVYGLRNPWRASIDRETGDLWIGDVGNVTREEIDFQAGSSQGGENYGWPIKEGAHDNAFRKDPSANDAALVPPIYDYQRSAGMCVTGGYVYRGRAMPWLHGTYFFADYAMGWIRSFHYQGEALHQQRDWTAMLEASLPADTPSLVNISSFGEDSAGELYVVDIGGGIYRLSQSPFEPWRSSHFSPSELREGRITDPDEDPVGDGMTNRDEFTAGADPLRPSARRTMVAGAIEKPAAPPVAPSLRRLSPLATDVQSGKRSLDQPSS